MAAEHRASETTRREVLQKAAFVAPAVLTLAAVPSFASAGSGKEEKEENYKEENYKEKNYKEKKNKHKKDKEKEKDEDK